MAQSLKLSNVWRIIREVDLEAIRREIHARLSLLVVDEHEGDAERIRALLSPGGERLPHPWIVTGRANATLPDLPVPPVAAVLVARGSRLGAGSEAARASLNRLGVPVITVLVVDAPPGAVPADLGEVARLAIPAIDSASGRALAGALYSTTARAQRYALGLQFPPLRDQVLDGLIEETARANAGYAFTTGLAEVVPVLTAPMNLGDMVILTKNQLLMGYRIVLIAGRDGDPRSMIGEILGVLGGGLLFRQAARQLVGLIPVWGVLPKVAIAYGGTWAIGRALAAWATEGRAVTAQTVRLLSTEGLARGRRVAESMVARARGTGERTSSRWARLSRQWPLAGRRRWRQAPATTPPGVDPPDR